MLISQQETTIKFLSSRELMHFHSHEHRKKKFNRQFRLFRLTTNSNSTTIDEN